LEYDAALMNSMTNAGAKWNEILSDPAKSFNENKDIVIQGFNEMFNAIESGALKAGDAATMLDDEWIDNMNDMAVKTGMSVTEMQDMLNSMGVSAKVEVKDVKQKVKVPVYETTTEDLSTDEEKAKGITRTRTNTV
jgi:hypothetical protein